MLSSNALYAGYRATYMGDFSGDGVAKIDLATGKDDPAFHRPGAGQVLTLGQFEHGLFIGGGPETAFVVDANTGAPQ